MLWLSSTCRRSIHTHKCASGYRKRLFFNEYTDSDSWPCTFVTVDGSPSEWHKHRVIFDKFLFTDSLYLTFSLKLLFLTRWFSFHEIISTAIGTVTSWASFQIHSSLFDVWEWRGILYKICANKLIAYTNLLIVWYDSTSFHMNVLLESGQETHIENIDQIRNVLWITHIFLSWHIIWHWHR